MALPFSSNAEQVISRELSTKEDAIHADVCDWNEFFEIEHCVQWIQEGNFKRIALQFPDEYLCIAASVSKVIHDRTKAEVFILADTSYGSCCVDEVAALHYNGEAIIHYGHSCLSPAGRLPVLFIFGKGTIDVKDCCEQFMKELPSTSKVLIVFGVEFNYVKDEIQKILLEHFNKVLILDVFLKDDTSAERTTKEQCSESVFKMYNRHFSLPSEDKIEDYAVLYIGQESMFLSNMMLALKDLTFYRYNPSTKTVQKQNVAVNKILMKRFYFVERIKDAQIVGILVATLTVARYLDIISRLKSLLSKAEKKYYVFSVGKINVPKLSNFPDVDIFVLVSCPESVILDSSEYYRPIVTPFEVELACDPEREWTGRLILDYSSLLPGGADHKELDLVKPLHEPDVSLITGRVRVTRLCDTETNLSGDGIISERSMMTLATVTGERFSDKSWQGLDPQLGQTEVTTAIPGRKGIPIQYEEEPT